MENLPDMSAFLTFACLQDGNCCTQMRGWIVKKFQHVRVPVEYLLDDGALHSLPAAVDEPHLAEPGGVCFIDVLLDHRGDVSRGECVKVEAALDRDTERPALSEAEGVLFLHCQSVAVFS